jgi:hypothetical protein
MFWLSAGSIKPWPHPVDMLQCISDLLAEIFPEHAKNTLIIDVRERCVEHMFL